MIIIFVSVSLRDSMKKSRDIVNRRDNTSFRDQSREEDSEHRMGSYRSSVDVASVRYD